MNRLILIGNGFDLAHKLKTSYNDFISSYLSESINSFYQNNSFEDFLLRLNPKYVNFNWSQVPKVTPETALTDFKNLKNYEHATVEVKSNFLLDTIDRLSTINWVDLENDYFDKLIGLKKGQRFDFDEVKNLNTEFDFIKVQLEKYLSRLDSESKWKYIDDYTQQFLAPIKYSDFVFKSLPDTVPIPNRIMFLNFNYTRTLKTYLDRCKTKTSCELIHIHGELSNTHNPIVFGFGDEFNKNYMEFEELRNKELLKHIKSFAYFKTSNYHDLMRFIATDDFEVFIYGHSLGLSDRTMLKQIFEHPNCISIRIFYHQNDKGYRDYTDKTYDISSHFSDKGIMRLKIVPEDLSFSMPQAKGN